MNVLRSKQVGERAVLIGVGLVLALVGVTDGVDAIVPWVFGIVDAIAPGDVWRPLYNPEPMDTYAYRPLSVVILKVLLVLTGRDPVAISAIHALILPVFALVARGFLIRHGFGSRVATLAAATSLSVPSLLFSAWICVEFDLVGAAVVLAAASQLMDIRTNLRDGRPVGRKWLVFWGLSVVAMTIKETSALQMLAWLAAFVFVHRREQVLAVRGRSWGWWIVGVGYLVGLAICTAPMHFVDSGNTHAFTVWSDGFHPIRIPAMLLHTGAQLVFAISFAGVVGMAAAALNGVRWRGPVLVIALLGLIGAAPVLRHYSHFEAVIFSHGAWTIVWVSLFVLALVALVVRSEAGSVERVAILTVLLTFLGYAAAPIVLRFARADVSARIFAACIPILHAVVWRAAAAGWRSGRAGRVVAVGVAVCVGGFVISSSWNTAVFHRSRIAVETEVKERLAADLRMPCPAIVNTNQVQLLTIEELRLMGGERLGECAWVQTTTTNPTAGMTIDDMATRGAVQADKGQDVYLFVQTARSQMDASLAPVLAGDFSWTSGLMPESDEDLFAGYQRMIYEIETDIEQLFMRDGLAVAKAHLDYVLLPLWWNELPARLIAGVPLVESYRYIARAYRIPARQPGYRPPGGRVRADNSRR